MATRTAPPASVDVDPGANGSRSTPSTALLASKTALLGGSNGIVNVWADNLREEMKKIIFLVEEYPYVAMDTEFPGVVARPNAPFKNQGEYQYNSLRCNVDILKIIQIGFSFFNDRGDRPAGTCTWQFNFKWRISEEIYSEDSIDLLQRSGIDFKAHEAKGIDPTDFAEVMMTSGLVLTEDVKWITFHSAYDFAYLLKVLTDSNLPKDEAGFFELFHSYFPCAYDLKCLMRHIDGGHGGLNRIAELLEVERIGQEHQAGSDSLLTGLAFFKMRTKFFQDGIDDKKFMGALWGIGFTMSKSSRAPDKEKLLDEDQ